MNSRSISLRFRERSGPKELMSSMKVFELIEGRPLQGLRLEK
jgi:hypothetical protein